MQPVVVHHAGSAAGRAAPATGDNPLPVIAGGYAAQPSDTFVRPADTTAYASGDLVANSTTAGSVVAMDFAVARSTGRGGMIRRVHLHKTDTGITNASFRVHLYSEAPAVTNGDNGAWLSTKSAAYLGSFDVTVDKAFSDGAAGIGVPNNGSEVNFLSDTVYALIEARGAYTPASGETFRVDLETLQN